MQELSNREKAIMTYTILQKRKKRRVKQSNSDYINKRFDAIDKIYKRMSNGNRRIGQV